MAEPRAPGSRLVPIGLDRDGRQPVSLDFDADPHLVVLGDAGSGKSTLLCAIVAGIERVYPPGEAIFLLVDPRHGLLDVASSSRVLSWVRARPEVHNAARDSRAALERRLPGPDVTQQQLCDRSWWSGPELFVVVDDYQTMPAHQETHPLLPLADLLPNAREIGLHLVIARDAGGAATAVARDRFLADLRAHGTPALIMNGNPAEGPLFGGVAPRAQPPGQGVLVHPATGGRPVVVTPPTAHP